MKWTLDRFFKELYQPDTFSLHPVFSSTGRELFRTVHRYILEENAFDETNASALKSAYAKEET